ncbi:hypothetical protein Sjap_019829 [Stephania japonica]|uniref:GATA-type domain-containing protein n=1 Tax=Stephania japonica TaxID=461633 RepID=A0AAP0F283_9MAGN
MTSSSSLSPVFAAEDDHHMMISSYEDHYQQQHLMHLMSSTANSSSNYSISLQDPPHHDDHQERPKAQYRQFLKEWVDVVSSGGSHDFRVLNSSPSPPTSLESNTDYGLKLSILHHGDHVEDQRCNKVANQVNTAIDIQDAGRGGVVVEYKWMPPKMRIMKKMTMMTNCEAHHQMIGFKHKSSTLLQDHLQQQPSPSLINSHSTHGDTSTSNSNTCTTGTVRVCSDCSTTKTPLWRSGPRGPKSLCNACGIRRRKARRAMTAAAATSTLDDVKPISTKVMKIKEKKLMVKRSTKAYLAPYKKVCKLVGATRSNSSAKQICVHDQNNDFSIGLSKKKNSLSPDHHQFHRRVFPQDEKEAAILLMALSCGS